MYSVQDCCVLKPLNTAALKTRAAQYSCSQFCGLWHLVENCSQNGNCSDQPLTGTGHAKFSTVFDRPVGSSCVLAACHQCKVGHKRNRTERGFERAPLPLPILQLLKDRERFYFCRLCHCDYFCFVLLPFSSQFERREAAPKKLMALV